MVERLVHTEEVTGSMPVSPTRESPGQSTCSDWGFRRFRIEHAVRRRGVAVIVGFADVAFAVVYDCRTWSYNISA
jgi:hypothetical protein